MTHQGDEADEQDAAVKSTTTTTFKVDDDTDLDCSSHHIPSEFHQFLQ
jgi:hypothetical protein